MQQSNLPALLKSKRVAAGLSQRDVSNKLGYSTPQFISNWERGVSSPPVKELRTIAKLYRTDADALFEVVLTETVNETVKTLKRRWKHS